MKKKFKYYTNGEKTIKIYEDSVIPEGFYEGNNFHRTPWNKGLTKETDARVLDNVTKASKTRKENNKPAWNKGLTKETDDRVLKNYENSKKAIKEKYNVDNISQYLCEQDGYQIWNKGLTKETSESVNSISEANKGKTPWNKGHTIETDSRITHHTVDDDTRDKIRKAHLDPDFQERRYQSMKERGTLCPKMSKAEKKYLEYLYTIYDKDDVIFQYFDKDRYPFKCDFYIKSIDLFIELNANWTHGKHPFDATNEEDIKTLKEWESKQEEKPYYKNAIYTWTTLDVRKQEIAKKNNLNYKVVY